MYVFVGLNFSFIGYYEIYVCGYEIFLLVKLMRKIIVGKTYVISLNLTFFSYFIVFGFNLCYLCNYIFIC